MLLYSYMQFFFQLWVLTSASLLGPDKSKANSSNSGGANSLAGLAGLGAASGLLPSALNPPSLPKEPRFDLAAAASVQVRRYTMKASI